MEEVLVVAEVESIGPGGREKVKSKQWKRISFVVMIVMVGVVALCGRGNKVKKLQPHEWILDGTVMSYYDDGNSIDETVCSKYTGFIEATWSDSKNRVAVREGEIRAFITDDKEVKTYKGISVGDSVKVLTDTFSYINGDEGICFYVFFDGTTEINVEEMRPEDRWICITYDLEDGIITRITISDAECARTWG